MWPYDLHGEELPFVLAAGVGRLPLAVGAELEELQGLAGP